MSGRLQRRHHIGQTVIPYTIDWSENRETMSLSIDDSLELTVTAPMTATVDDVEEVLESRHDWLLEKLYGLKEQEGPPYPKEYLTGEKLQYRGRQYPLEVIEADVDQPELAFDDQTFTLRVHRLDAEADDISIRRKRQAVVDWYINRAKEELPKRAVRFESRLGLENVPVEVGEIDGRWGEFADGTVWLNWRIVQAPVRIQNYVIAHEMAHAVHNEHSDSFWNTVGALIPDYEDRREWLRVNGNTLAV
ncbi:putative metal-dependent hydrolase [Halanaeroarchaeum sp. HSR-CO]|uniref:M48 family metallopeptidase n=1 Tax=Halanaeroarchaeum sp. HSR-CO TaxID=2866382 RepID=UPI00217EFE1A|nr:SprT family zinc-dependent metalloprotease [Halanaeroarchaeum sp. HSR-CO]UWG46777.1 putative metal-dependent hydrolase [Halanaeroarchaeum sp. HSR-CO]